MRRPTRIGLRLGLLPLLLLSGMGVRADDGTADAAKATAAAAAEAAAVGANAARGGVVGGMLTPSGIATQQQEDRDLERRHQDEQRQTHGGYTPSIDSMPDGRR